MGCYHATVHWNRGDALFVDNRYSRAHEWIFDGGATVPASSSPHIVPTPMSDVAAVDPEEALVASVSSCHMLFFLALAARAGCVVERYVDHAIGEMAADERGRQFIARVTLRPDIAWFPAPPEAALVERLHHDAHEACFIANSLRGDVVVAPVPA